MKKILLILVAMLLVTGGGFVGYKKLKKQDNQVPSSNMGAQTIVTGDQSAIDEQAAREFEDACVVIDKADLETAFGVSFNESEAEEGITSKDGQAGSACVYRQANDGGAEAQADAIDVTIKLENYNTSSTASTEMQNIVAATKVGDRVLYVITPAPNIGEGDAFFRQDQSETVLKTEELLYTRKGRQIISFVAVRSAGIDHAATKTSLTSLAQSAFK